MRVLLALLPVALLAGCAGSDPDSQPSGSAAGPAGEAGNSTESSQAVEQFVSSGSGQVVLSAGAESPAGPQQVQGTVDEAPRAPDNATEVVLEFWWGSAAPLGTLGLWVWQESGGPTGREVAFRVEAGQDAIAKLVVSGADWAALVDPSLSISGAPDGALPSGGASATYEWAITFFVGGPAPEGFTAFPYGAG